MDPGAGVGEHGRNGRHTGTASQGGAWQEPLICRVETWGFPPRAIRDRGATVSAPASPCRDRVRPRMVCDSSLLDDHKTNSEKHGGTSTSRVPASCQECGLVALPVHSRPCWVRYLFPGFLFPPNISQTSSFFL